MKKIISALAGVLIVCMLCTSALALALKPNNDVCRTAFSLKNADADAVVKDGKIDLGGGEYERLYLDTDPESADTDLTVGFGSDKMFDYAYEMCSTMEYYFSWDSAHGFNFAVRYKPHKIKQELQEGEGEIPKDDFARQVAVNFVSYPALVRPDADMHRMLYYSIAKSTLTGRYMEGHWNQLGVTEYYDPVAGEDYVIAYEPDGHVVCEWSVPFAKLGANGDIGECIYFSISATAGEDLEGDGHQFNTAYAVSLGDYGFMCKMTGDKQMATAVISDDEIKAAGDTSPDNGDTAGPAPGDITGSTGAPAGDDSTGIEPEPIPGAESEESTPDTATESTQGTAESVPDSYLGTSTPAAPESGTTPSDVEDTYTPNGQGSPKPGTSTPTAPQTGDAEVIFVLIIMLCLCGMAKVRKLRA